MTDPAQLRALMEAAAKAWTGFVSARGMMNAAIPALDATPAERALYDERYKADHEAEREHWRTAIALAQESPALLNRMDAAEAEIQILRRALAWHGDLQRMATTREEWQQVVDDAIVWVKANPEPDRPSFSTFDARAALSERAA